VLLKGLALAAVMTVNSSFLAGNATSLKFELWFYVDLRRLTISNTCVLVGVNKIRGLRGGSGRMVMRLGEINLRFAAKYLKI